MGSPLKKPENAATSFKKVELPGLMNLIGNTPLVRVYPEWRLPSKVEVWAKLESFNPGGSVKDRPALQMVLDGIEAGKFTKDKILLDSTSGNTGIAYAIMGTVMDFRVRLAMPSNVSIERKKILDAFGAEIVYSDPLEGSDGAILEARRLLEKDPDLYFKPDQYNNPSNPKAHYLSTGPEIWEQTKGRITHFAAGIGTGGTVMGVGRFLKEKDPSIEVIAIEPACPLHGLEGLKHMSSSIVPDIYHEDKLDRKVNVETEDAYSMVKYMACKRGMLIGQSSGAALFGAFQIAKELDEGVVVTVLPDGGDKYLSTAMWLD